MSATTDKRTASQPKVEKAALLDDEGDLTEKVRTSQLDHLNRQASLLTRSLLTCS